ncbi:hypothetical protein PVAP13_2NG469706 [Panicum virgatum]|uniref:Uncharacterized protein n=1 Tax=Panicum virgatum TaxID=38727 RepID=A0A8T0VNB4_PANVG|nr:hypothetical protein PVAP13_2NG469706 [Panicum virgatum]
MASAGRPRGQPGRGSVGPGVTRRRVAAGAGGVAGARSPVPLPPCRGGRPGSPLPSGTPWAGATPFPSPPWPGGGRRPGLGMRSAGARSLGPAGPSPMWTGGGWLRSRRCGAARPLLPLRDAATTSVRGGPARSRPGARARVGPQWPSGGRRPGLGMRSAGARSLGPAGPSPLWTGGGRLPKPEVRRRAAPPSSL